MYMKQHGWKVAESICDCALVACAARHQRMVLRVGVLCANTVSCCLCCRCVGACCDISQLVWALWGAAGLSLKVDATAVVLGARVLIMRQC